MDCGGGRTTPVSKIWRPERIYVVFPLYKNKKY
jgi:hypothetical protein